MVFLTIFFVLTTSITTHILARFFVFIDIPFKELKIREIHDSLNTIGTHEMSPEIEEDERLYESVIEYNKLNEEFLELQFTYYD